MSFIKKRLRGLAALITAAGAALTSLPMTAAAESSSEPITVNVTVEERKSKDFTEKKAQEAKKTLMTIIQQASTMATSLTLPS